MYALVYAITVPTIDVLIAIINEFNNTFNIPLSNIYLKCFKDSDVSYGYWLINDKYKNEPNNMNKNINTVYVSIFNNKCGILFSLITYS